MEFAILFGGLACIPIIHLYTRPVSDRNPGFIKQKPLPTLTKSASFDQVFESRKGRFKSNKKKDKEQLYEDFTDDKKNDNRIWAIFAVILVALVLYLAVVLNK